MRHRRETLFVLLCAVALAVACGGKVPPTLSPEGARAWKANQAVLTINTVQRTAIGMNAIMKCQGQPEVCAPLLSDANTKIVVDNVAVALTSLKAAPAGWFQTASTALTQIRNQLDASGKKELAAWLDVAKVVMEDLR